MQTNGNLSRFARMFSALIWLGVLYLTFPRLFRFTFAESFGIAVIVAALVFIYDVVLFGFLQSRSKQTGEYRFALAGRLGISAIFSLVGAFGITVNVFLTQMNRYLPGKRANYIQKFMIGIEDSATILLVFIVLVLLFFLLDNIGRFAARLTIQNSVIREKVDIIRERDTQLSLSHQHQLELVAGIQHELGGKLSLVKNTLADFDVALHELQQRLPGFSMENKIRMRLHGESADSIDSYNDLLQRMHAGLNYSLTTVQNIRGIIHADPSRFDPQARFLQSWLKSEIPKHLPNDVSVDPVVEGDNPELLADYRQLSILLHNVIENAVRHGFQQAPPPHRLYFFIQVVGMRVTLEIHNTGYALPAGFNEIEYFQPGKIFGNTGHSGLGGYLVGMIAASHKANVQVQPSTRPGFATMVIITFNPAG